MDAPGAGLGAARAEWTRWCAPRRSIGSAIRRERPAGSTLLPSLERMLGKRIYALGHRARCSVQGHGCREAGTGASAIGSASCACTPGAARTFRTRTAQDPEHLRPPPCRHWQHPLQHRGRRKTSAALRRSPASATAGSWSPHRLPGRVASRSRDGPHGGCAQPATSRPTCSDKVDLDIRVSAGGGSVDRRAPSATAVRTRDALISYDEALRAPLRRRLRHPGRTRGGTQDGRSAQGAQAAPVAPSAS